MKSKGFRTGTFRVSVLLETSREYGRGLLRGIGRYHAMHKRWRIDLPPCETRGASCADSEGRRGHDKGFPQDVNGVIMRDHRGAPALLKRGIPIVFAAHFHKEIRGSHRILPDDPAIGRMAASHLLERGFRRFAFVGYDGLYWSRQRQESFSRAVSDAGRECTVFKQAKDLRLRVWRRERKVLADWLKSLPRPLGLMACDDERARQVVEACAMAQLAVPEDVAIIGVDNDEFVCRLSNPPISSIALNTEDAGYRAAMLLDRLMSGRTLKPQNILVSPVAVVTRSSTDTVAVDDPAVAAALRFIRENGGRAIQVSDVVTQAAISRRSLFDRFRRITGCTVHQHIKKTRVVRIEELLLGTSYTVGEIAEILGFPNSDHVAMYFRSAKGMNPQAFRAQFPCKQ